MRVAQPFPATSRSQRGTTLLPNLLPILIPGDAISHHRHLEENMIKKKMPLFASICKTMACAYELSVRGRLAEQ